jgi:hypothetical protein
MIFILIIEIIKLIGNGVVWCNDNIIKFGDYCGEKSGANEVVLKYQMKLKGLK